MKKVVLVGGCFDLFHYGHLIFLDRAKKLGDYLVVALESDESIRRKKGRKPIHSQKQRMAILNTISLVDKVIPLPPSITSDQGYFELVKKIKPSFIAVTKNDPKLQNKIKQAKTVNAQVKIVTPIIKNLSTNKIRQLCDYL